MAAGPLPRSERPRRKTVVALVVLSTILGLLAVFAVWAKRQLLETDTWVDTSTELLADQDVQEAVSGFMVDGLYSSVDVEAQLQAKLPPQAAALAGPASGALRELAGRLALEALQRPQVQDLWADANRAAHAQFITVIEGGGPTVSTTGGDVTLDLGTMIEQLGARAGIDVAGKVPDSVSQIEILSSDELGTAQDAVNLLRKLVYILSFAALILFALAVYLAKGWRREALRAVGWAFVLIGIVVVVVRSVAGNYLTDSLASTESVKPAVQSTWSIATRLLHDGGLAMILYGLAIVGGAWLAGPGSLARSARRGITPIIERRAIGYAVLGVIVLLVLWWNPTPGTSRLGPSLVLLVLLVAGFEALRAQAIRDFPDQTWDGATERWGSWWGERAEHVKARRQARTHPNTAPTDDRLDQLERLARLRESGVLTDEELAKEKERMLA
jgi:hypothetical protein